MVRWPSRDEVGGTEDNSSTNGSKLRRVVIPQPVLPSARRGMNPGTRNRLSDSTIQPHSVHSAQSMIFPHGFQSLGAGCFRALGLKEGLIPPLSHPSLHIEDMAHIGFRGPVSLLGRPFGGIFGEHCGQRGDVQTVPGPKRYQNRDNDQ